jgi:hypothetical protein
MAKYLPPGYLDCALGIQRDDDPDPYSITFGAEIDTTPWTQANNDELATSCTNVLLAILSDASQFTSLSTKVGSDGEGPIFESTIDEVGLRSGDLGTPNTASLWRKNTGLGGRHNRGRWYWPSVPQSNMTASGIMTQGETDFEQDFAGYFLDVLQGTDGSNPTNTSNLVLIHSPRSGEATPTPTAVTTFVVQRLLATQRRRLRS